MSVPEPGQASDTAHEATQDGPALAQNETTEIERLDGIVQQTRADVHGQSLAVAEQSLRRRLADAGIELDEDEIRSLARKISAD